MTSYSIAELLERISGDIGQHIYDAVKDGKTFEQAKDLAMEYVAEQMKDHPETQRAFLEVARTLIVTFETGYLLGKGELEAELQKTP